MSEEKFETWGVLELMGHLRLAGHISEEAIGGASFIRIDVPASEKREGYTRYFGAQSVYSMSPTTEEIARSVAKRCYGEPVSIYDIQPQEPPGIECENEGEDYVIPEPFSF